MIEPNYYQLANAAEKIGCAKGYLIDLGADGLLRMFATLSYHYPDWIDYAAYGMESDKVKAASVSESSFEPDVRGGLWRDDENPCGM